MGTGLDQFPEDGEVEDELAETGYGVGGFGDAVK